MSARRLGKRLAAVSCRCAADRFTVAAACASLGIVASARDTHSTSVNATSAEVSDAAASNEPKVSAATGIGLMPPRSNSWAWTSPNQQTLILGGFGLGLLLGC